MRPLNRSKAAPGAPTVVSLFIYTYKHVKLRESVKPASYTLAKGALKDLSY